MPWEAWTTLIVVGLVLLALARNLAQPDMIFLGAIAILMSIAVVSNSSLLPTPRKYAELFGNEGLLTVGALYIVAAGLTQTGGLAMVTDRLLGRPKSLLGAQVRMLLPVTGFSSVLNNTPVVAMFVPVLNDWCRRSRFNPAKLFIPLSYAAILGGTCTLVGTSTNLVVAGLMQEQRAKNPAAPVMGFWTIGAVGIPAAVVGIGFLLLVGRRLLPNRKDDTIEHTDPRQYTVEMIVEAGSAMDGKTVEQAGLRHLPGAYLVEIDRNGEILAAVGPEQVLRGGDRLIFVGVVESVKDLQRFRGLAPATNQVFKLDAPRPDRCLVEAVISPSCSILNQTIREGRFRTRFGAAVIAVHRGGQRLAGKIGDITLAAGDTLLLETHPRFLDQYRDSRDFLLVSSVADSQPRRHNRAGIALLILAGMVAAMAIEGFGGSVGFKISVFHLAVVAAGLMVLTGCCSGDQARRSIDWPTLVAIGASFGLGQALQSSGAAKGVSSIVVGALHGLGPVGVLAGIYLITLLFTEMVTNNAAAALAFPIAHAVAAAQGWNFMPFAMAIAMAASSGFAVPAGYATHMMVNGPGGYRFSDWLKIGIPMDLLIMAVTVTVAPLMFPF